MTNVMSANLLACGHYEGAHSARAMRSFWRTPIVRTIAEKRRFYLPFYTADEAAALRAGQYQFVCPKCGVEIVQRKLIENGSCMVRRFRTGNSAIQNTIVDSYTEMINFPILRARETPRNGQIYFWVRGPDDYVWYMHCGIYNAGNSSMFYLRRTRERVARECS